MRKLFRSTLLLAFTATTLTSCELIPDEVIDILNPQPKPGASCELVEINHPSENPQDAFIVTIDSTGENEITIRQTSTLLGDIYDVTKIVTSSEPNKKFVQFSATDGTTYQQVIGVDALKRLKKVSTFYNAMTIETEYTYEGNGDVEAVTTQMTPEDTTSYLTVFEYTLGNLTKIHSGEEVEEERKFSYEIEYGDDPNKLYSTESEYVGLGVFSPLAAYMVDVETDIPMPSRNLPKMSASTLGTSSPLEFSWRFNEKGYPTEASTLNAQGNTFVYLYGYSNCSDESYENPTK